MISCMPERSEVADISCSSSITVSLISSIKTQFGLSDEEACVGVEKRTFGPKEIGVTGVCGVREGILSTLRYRSFEGALAIHDSSCPHAMFEPALVYER